MQLNILETADELGRKAAEEAAAWLRQQIGGQGRVRVVLSTGASQFAFFEHFVKQELDWSAVEMFHLDEYIGLPESHPASFRRYLRQRFVSLVPLRKAHLIDGEGDAARMIAELEAAAAEAPFDLGLIGIGENAHIAFNDPPADFATDSAYKIVDLDEDCKAQQVREGWFATNADVPAQAISMTVKQIMRCRRIISCVPGQVKAKAIQQTLASELTPMVPATMLKRHPEWSLYLDRASASLLPVVW